MSDEDTNTQRNTSENSDTESKSQPTMDDVKSYLANEDSNENTTNKESESKEPTSKPKKKAVIDRETFEKITNTPTGEVEEEQKKSNVDVPDESVFKGQEVNKIDGIQNREIELTKTDKQQFLKAILVDQPFTQVVKMFDGEFNVELKTRTTFEQQVLHAAVSEDTDNGTINSLKDLTAQAQKYSAVFMLKSINNIPFDCVTLDSTLPMQEAKQQLRQEVAAKISPMQLEKWAVISNALAYFELKTYKLTDACFNEEDF